jgi:arginase
MQQLVLIEAPSNLGLKEPFPGVEPGVKFFPSAMEEAGFASSAGISEKINVAAPLYSMEVDPESKVRNAWKIIQYSTKLADEIDNSILQRNLPVVIGGDCSILIGAALSLKRNGNYGLFFLDGHTDYVLPEQSGTAGAAGMDLAIVTGNGHQKLTNIENRKPYIVEKNVFCVGNREISVDWYVNAIIESDIHYYDLYSLRSKGISFIVNQFLSMVDSKNLDGFWIHFDVDVLDNKIMPCVDSPQEDGLSYEELEEVLNPLIGSEYFTGIDVTIYDPTLDRDGFFGKQFANQLTGIVSNISVKD